MSLDITHILENWSYKPGQVSARRVRGDDGRDLIQLRVDLGMLQMETTGRPDGRKPHGRESLLEHYERNLARHLQRGDSEEDFTLDERDCELLRAEGVIFYHRYLAEFVLEDFAAVERDTERNLRLMDFCAAHGKEPADRHMLEQYRPYVVMMWARARAHVRLRDNRPKAALAAVKEGIKRIEAFYHDFDQDDMIEHSGEIAVLRAMAKDAERRIPLDPVVRLRRDLAKAVSEERYEDAAKLRDRLSHAGAAETAPADES